MFTLLCAVCVMGMPGADLDGEDAIAKGQKVLAGLGLTEQMPLVSLQNHHYITKEKCWSVTLGTKQGPVNIVLNAHTGKPLFIQAITTPARTRLTNLPATSKTSGRAHTLLHQLGYDKDVVMDPIGGVQNGVYSAVFRRTVHGLTFFNLNPTYAHSLWFEPESGAINHFSPSQPLPEVSDWKPKISAKQALAKITAWAAERAKIKHRQDAIDPTFGQPMAELGYWNITGEKTARLVWRGQRVYVTYGRILPMGAYTVFVDALTGELIVPNDPGMGEYP